MTNEDNFRDLLSVFISKDIEPFLFVHNYLKNIDSYTLEAFYKYLSGKQCDKDLKFFFDNDFRSIEISINDNLLELIPNKEKQDYIEGKLYDKFDSRIKLIESELKPEISKLIDIIKNTSQTEQLESDIIKGLNYTDKKFKDNLQELCYFLIDNKRIKEIDVRHFYRLFSEEFPKDTKRIVWLGKKYTLAHFLRKLISSKKFDIPTNNYWQYINNIFLNKDGKTFYVGTSLRDNNFIPKKEKGKQELESFLQKIEDIVL